jgi:hypothetical protein
VGKSSGDVNKGVDMNEVLLIKRIYPDVKKGDSIIARDLGKQVYSIKDLQQYTPTEKEAKALKSIMTNIGAANNNNTDITNKQLIDDIESQLAKAESTDAAPRNYRGDIVKTMKLTLTTELMATTI